MLVSIYLCLYVCMFVCMYVFMCICVRTGAYLTSLLITSLNFIKLFIQTFLFILPFYCEIQCNILIDSPGLYSLL